MPPYNVRKDAIERHGLTLAEIGTLKRGEDVIRKDCVIPHSEAAYIPFVPRSYAYCSDTAPFPELADWVKGVSLLYHESTFPAEMSEMAEKTFHSTTLQAAQVALDAGVGRLLVGHYSSRFPSVDFYLDELRTIFPDTDLAHDGDVVEIPYIRNL
jgi:ribonuclease Z